MPKITLHLQPADVLAIARVLDATANGEGFDFADECRQADVLHRLVNQAAVKGSLTDPAVRRCVERDCDQFWGRAALRPRRLPKSRRPGPGGRA